MSLLLLIDGYNLAHPIAPSRDPDPRWLQRIRGNLLRDLSDGLTDELRRRTCVVFDAAHPPKDRPDAFVHDGIQVRFAVGYPAADDLLEELIQAHHTPKQLTVVSSDHRVQVAAKRRGAGHFDGEPWLDDLTEGRVHLAYSPARSSADGEREPPAKPRVESESEVDQWMRDFGFEAGGESDPR